MAITTDSYIDVRDSQSALQDKIGLSDTLDNYTLEELTSYCYCGANNNFIKYPLKRSDVQAFLSGVDIPYHMETDASNRMVFTEGDRTPYAGNEDLYGRVVWLQNITNISSNVITSANCANYKLVTEMKANHYCYEWNAPNVISCGASTYGTTDWSGSDMTTHKVWYSSGGSLSYYKDFTGGEIIILSSEKIHPFFLCEIDGKMYCLSLGFNINHYKSNYNFYTLDPSYPPEVGYSYTSWDETDSFDVAVAAQQTWDNTFANTGWNYPYVYPRTAPGQYGWATILQGFDDDNINGFGVVGGSEYNLDMGWEFHYYFKERDDAYKLISGAGLYFKTDKIYKPIIQNGYVIDYTDELSTTSDIDTWEGSTNHNIPPTPPTPPTPSGDDMDTMATGATGSSGGFTHFYIMSPQDLIDLLADFYTRADPGETLSNNLVCSYILGIPSSEFCATESVPVTIHNSAQGTPFVSQANYSHVTATNNLLVVGNFDVPRMTNTFYDFSPYSTYEVFIPCCGWVPLPDTVAGRKIYVEMYIDIASCCVKASVKISGDGVCAVENGVLGASIPMAVIESGILRGNNIQGGLGIISGGINTGIGAGNGNALGIGFGVQQILGGLIDCTIAGNTNYTQQKGGTGDITQFAMGHKCYLKVTHPELDSVVNESIFGHSVGYLCNSIGKLSDYHGFTVCGNPHVTFSASAEEREEIERLLSMGVILPASE